MEKINREELMKKLKLTEEDLEKVTGGVNFQCFGICVSNCIEVNGDSTQVEGACVDYCFRAC